MGTWLLKIVLLGEVLLMGLPPGWCCAEVAPSEAMASRPTSCCAAATPGDAEGASAPAPVTPAPRGAECCCPREATVPASIAVLRSADEPLFAIPEPPIAVEPRHASLTVAESYLFHSAGPPLRVLHCVWLN